MVEWRAPHFNLVQLNQRAQRYGLLDRSSALFSRTEPTEFCWHVAVAERWRVTGRRNWFTAINSANALRRSTTVRHTRPVWWCRNRRRDCPAHRMLDDLLGSTKLRRRTGRQRPMAHTDFYSRHSWHYGPVLSGYIARECGTGFSGCRAVFPQQTRVARGRSMEQEICNAVSCRSRHTRSPAVRFGSA
jgi:hypothetical protein